MPARNCRSRLLPRRAANGPRSSRKQPFEAVLFRAVVADPVVHRAMMKVRHLLQPQRLLQQPVIMQRIEAVAANPGLNGPNNNDKARKSGSHVTRRCITRCEATRRSKAPPIGNPGAFGFVWRYRPVGARRSSLSRGTEGSNPSPSTGESLPYSGAGFHVPAISSAGSRASKPSADEHHRPRHPWDGFVWGSS
jgi:hypothetical protein